MNAYATTPLQLDIEQNRVAPEVTVAWEFALKEKAPAFTDANWIKPTLISDLSRPYFKVRICTLCTFHSLECTLDIEAEHTIQLDRLILQCGFACIKGAELGVG